MVKRMMKLGQRSWRLVRLSLMVKQRFLGRQSSMAKQSWMMVQLMMKLEQLSLKLVQMKFLVQMRMGQLRDQHRRTNVLEQPCRDQLERRIQLCWSK
jgi:hypothetical protein